jgi:hypothetical protein
MSRQSIRDHDAASERGEPQTEVEVLASHPEVIAVKAGAIDGVPADEEANTLRPIELGKLLAAPSPVLIRAEFLRSEPMQAAITKARSPRHSTCGADDKGITRNDFLGFHRISHGTNRIWLQDGVVIEHQQVSHLRTGDFPRALFRCSQPAATPKIMRRRHVLGAHCRSLYYLANVQSRGIIAHENSVHPGQGSE